MSESNSVQANHLKTLRDIRARAVRFRTGYGGRAWVTSEPKSVIASDVIWLLEYIGQIESQSGGNPGQPKACTTAEEGGIAGATGGGQLPHGNRESTCDSAERRSPAGHSAPPAPDASNRQPVRRWNAKYPGITMLEHNGELIRSGFGPYVLAEHYDHVLSVLERAVAIASDALCAYEISGEYTRDTCPWCQRLDALRARYNEIKEQRT